MNFRVFVKIRLITELDELILNFSQSSISKRYPEMHQPHGRDELKHRFIVKKRQVKVLLGSLLKRFSGNLT